MRPSSGVLGVQQREVGREPLTQPDVVPVALGHRIAEPLVGGLVDDGCVAGGYPLLAIKDVRRVLGSSAHAGGLHVRQLLIGVGPDVLREELERPARVAFERLQALVRVLRKHPEGQLDALHRRFVVHDEMRDAERVEPRRDRHVLRPVCAAQGSRQIDLVHQQAVADHLILGLRRNDEFRCRLVGDVIESWAATGGRCGTSCR